LSTGRSGCTQKRVDSLKEIFRPQAKRTEICRKLFLTEIVGFVESIKDLDKAVNSSCQTTRHQVNFSTRGRLVGIVERESGAPEEVFDDGLLEMRGVGPDLSRPPPIYRPLAECSAIHIILVNAIIASLQMDERSHR